MLVNNAGYSQSGAVETVPPDAVRRQFETNVFGLIRMCQLVLPGMRDQHWGKIVNIGSMGGKLTFPGGGLYHATKYAVEALSDALRFEVRGFGVDVILVEPGLITTEFAADRRRPRSARRVTAGLMPSSTAAWRRSPKAAYKGPLRRFGGGPEAVAEHDRGRAQVWPSEAALSGHAERAPDDQPAPLHARSAVGPHDASAVPDAQGLALERHPRLELLREGGEQPRRGRRCPRC